MSQQQKTAVQAARVEPLTDAEREYVEKLIARIGGRRSIRAKACWRNSQRLLLNDDKRRLRYWECGLPIPHAWVTINGKVVDVTAEAANRALKRMGYSPDGSTNYQYRGVTVNRDVVLKHVHQTHSFGAVLGETWWTE
jgi:hypothetical protein